MASETTQTTDSQFRHKCTPDQTTSPLPPLFCIIESVTLKKNLMFQLSKAYSFLFCTHTYACSIFFIFLPPIPGGKDREMCQFCGNREAYSTVIPRGTAPNRRFLPSQQYNRQQTEHKGSSSYGAFGQLGYNKQEH